MRSEDLYALAAAHGIDLVQAARVAASSARRDVEIRHRLGVASTKLLEPRANRARGAETATTVRPEWTIAELGQAAAGVPKIPFMAACYAFAGDRSCLWRLYDALLSEAQKISAQQRWPAELVDLYGIQSPYLKRLCKLVLDEDATPSSFQTVPQLYAIYMCVSEKTWKNPLSNQFDELKFVWQDWLNIAARTMQPRLASEDDEGA